MAVLRTVFLLLFASLLPLASFATDVTLNKIEDRSHVCMVNDAYMGATQIPVMVDGKTYYGCCPGCASTLKSEASARTAEDPLTRKAVDKATAFIAMDKDGKAFYFESEETFKRYLKGD